MTKRKIDPQRLAKLAAATRKYPLPPHVGAGHRTPPALAASIDATKLRAAADVLEALPSVPDRSDTYPWSASATASYMRNVADGLESTALLKGNYDTPSPLIPSVASYFESRLGHPLRDPQTSASSRKDTLTDPDFLIDSGCGEDCAKAIDSGAALIAQIRAAYSYDRPSLVAGVQDTVTEIIACFFYG